MLYDYTLLETLRQRGYRVTPQRELIIKAVAHSRDHLTAEEIFESVQSHTQAINVATVYRTLDFLVKQGLASKADLGGGRVVFATTRHGSHIHLVCRQCGSVIEADAGPLTALEEVLRERYGFEADTSHLSLPGVCAGCRTDLTQEPAGA